jgi:Xaa-Pro aminopeptidase
MARDTATIMAGVPSSNAALYRAIRFNVGDPVALISIRNGQTARSILILRDIEMERARASARADEIACPADFTPKSGLSGDRETATAQAAAECLKRHGIKQLTADRSLPFIFADIIRNQGIDIECDLEMGVVERRSKDDQEIQWLREAQKVTEGAIEMACRMVARANAGADGWLRHQGEQLTSELIRREIDLWLLDKGYVNPMSIVASGPQGADCHCYGSGPIRTEVPVIIDVFPQNRETKYYGDCTRTVVHGKISDRIKKMHAAVVDAKKAGVQATRAGVTGEHVHQAVISRIKAHGFNIGLPGESDPDDYTAMVHGTGHGIGLDVHEPPLLDFKGPPLVTGDALTIEPGLYSKAIGGIRVEDMVIVTENGCASLNTLPEGLSWE